MAFGYEQELKAEIARLRDALDEQTGRAAWNYDCLTQCEERVIQRDAEIERLRLTHAEREAVEWFAEVSKPLARLTKSNRREQYISTLRGLLERLGPTAGK